jgi:hypothetical protein
MTIPTPRAALERLLARLDETTDKDGPVPAWMDSYCTAVQSLKAEPELEGPSLNDVDELCAEFGFHLDGDQGDGFEILRDMITAAIARWRAPVVEPFTPPASEQGDAWWHELISEIARVQHVAQGEGQGPRFDLAKAVKLSRRPTPPAPEPPAESLAARPLLEQVSRLGRIGAPTMSEIVVISNRAAAWLRQNPPSQPVAIEPRGCPTPGAGSCVEPTPPAPEVGELSTDFRSLCAAMLSWWGLLALPECARPQDQALFDELGRLARAALKAEPVATPATQELDGDRVQKLAAIIREADPARLPRAWSHQFAQALLAHPGFSGCCDGPAAPPAPEPPAEALAARPLLEQVAAMADCIGAKTVGQITAISNRAAVWLRENPPGRPAAIEPTPPAPEPGEVGELVNSLTLIGDGMNALNHEADSWVVARAATLLQQQESGLAALRGVPVGEDLPKPNTKVLAFYLNKLGKGRTICAIWVPAKTRVSDSDIDEDLEFEYDDETDQFYWPEGWYETIENWEEFGYLKVYEGEVVYWQPLPKWPANALPAPQAGEAQPPHPTFLDAIRLAQGCHDYSGGHSGQQGEAFQDGVGTVVAVLKKAAVGSWDSQTMAVFGVGSAPQAGEGEA